MHADFLRQPGANLRNAILVEATFEHADLRNADLRADPEASTSATPTSMARTQDTPGGPGCPQSSTPTSRSATETRLTATCREEYRTLCCNLRSGTNQGMKACSAVVGHHPPGADRYPRHPG
jgi:uncharacterized protein YjbI with pentapeptide repeats